MKNFIHSSLWTLAFLLGTITSTWGQPDTTKCPGLPEDLVQINNQCMPQCWTFFDQDTPNKWYTSIETCGTNHNIEAAKIAKYQNYQENLGYILYNGKYYPQCCTGQF